MLQCWSSIGRDLYNLISCHICVIHREIHRKHVRYWEESSLTGRKRCFFRPPWTRCHLDWPEMITSFPGHAEARHVALSTFHSQEWSTSNFSWSLTSNVTSHSMKRLAVHSLLRLKHFCSIPILTTSLIHFSIKGWENVPFELGSERVNAPVAYWGAFSNIACRSMGSHHGMRYFIVFSQLSARLDDWPPYTETRHILLNATANNNVQVITAYKRCGRMGFCQEIWRASVRTSQISSRTSA